jgi:hypothetical protein
MRVLQYFMRPYSTPYRILQHTISYFTVHHIVFYSTPYRILQYTVSYFTAHRIVLYAYFVRILQY